MKPKIILIVLLIAVTASVYAQPKKGDLAPEISLKDIHGKTISTADLKGKIVLIDFWASWCGPCRRSNKEIQPLYSKYKSQGFEIYGISLDDEIADWKKAIAKDKISWLQVSEAGGWDSPTALKWNIEALPSSFLLNKEGKIIALNPEVPELENLLQKLL